MENGWELDEKVFGPLWKYVLDDEVTDIDWDGGNMLWIKNARGQVYEASEALDDIFIENFSQYVANHESQAFNQISNVISTETDTLRITIAHESLVKSGRCFSIRKSLPRLRFCPQEAINNGYCSLELMHFLVNCVTAHMNMAFCGEPGHGKTEAAKFFSSFIDKKEKVITVEDTLEWHYGAINPGKRFDEIKVNSSSDYTKSIKLALRLNPTWLMLSEARSAEVRYLLEGWSTGVHGMTTLHTSCVENIPDRIVNMMDKVESSSQLINNLYTYLNVGILLGEQWDELETRQRKIMQVGVFERRENHNYCHVIFEQGKLYKERIPDTIYASFLHAGIQDPFVSEELTLRIKNQEMREEGKDDLGMESCQPAANKSQPTHVEEA